MNGAKDIRVLLRKAVKAGAVVERRNGHTRIICPNGAKVTVSGSPSCPHAAKNAARELRKYGQLDL